MEGNIIFVMLVIVIFVLLGIYSWNEVKRIEGKEVE
jgi:hypothetical protein